MGQPDWSRIPFEKMPEWKREEILAKSKKTIEVLEGNLKLKCDVCGKVCGSQIGLNSHTRSHAKA